MPAENQGASPGQDGAAGQAPAAESDSARLSAAMAAAEAAWADIDQGEAPEPAGSQGAPAAAEAEPQAAAPAASTTLTPEMRGLIQGALADMLVGMHQASTARAAERIQQPTASPPAKKPRRGPPTEDDLAREMARRLAPADLDEDELTPYADDARQRLALSEWLRTNADHEQAPYVREKLASLQSRAHTANLERQLHEMREHTRALEEKIGEIQTAPQRAETRKSQINSIAMVLGDASNAEKTGYSSLHRIAATSPETAQKLAERIYERAVRDGMPKGKKEFTDALDQAALELEDLYSLAAPSAAGDRPATKTRPDVTPRAAGGSPARRSKDAEVLEDWSKMTESQRRKAAIRAAEDVWRQGDINGRSH